MPLTMQALDHLVVQVSDVEASAQWYGRALGMIREDVPPEPGKPPRTAMRFGRQKINLRPIVASKAEWFTADHEAAGSEDLCFLTELDAGPGRRASADPRDRHRDRPRTQTGRPGNAHVRLLPGSGRQPDRDRLLRRRLGRRAGYCSA